MSLPTYAAPATPQPPTAATVTISGMTPATCAHFWPTLSIDTLHGTGLGGVRDQGTRATCLAFAASAAHPTQRNMADALSPEWLFCAAKQIDGWPDESTTPDAIRAALLNVGQPEESVWPYETSRVHGIGAYLPPPLNGAPCHTHRSSMLPVEISTVTQALDGGTVVVLGLAITMGFVTATASGGRIGPRETHTPVVGHHAVVAIGYGSEGTTHETHIVIRNSWGAAWGCDGYALVAAPYLQAHLHAAFVVA